MNKSLSKTSNNIPWSLVTIALLFIFAVIMVFVYRKWTYNYVIVWDAWSYYAYLPAAFIERDLTLSFIDQHPEYMQTRYWPLPAPNGNWVIKTTMGMSFIYLPYFIIGHIWALIHTGMPADGFSQPYQIMIALSGPCSMVFGSLALRKVLRTYYSEGITALCILGVILGTNAANYVSSEGAMSHIHNFMLISFFLRQTQLWHENPNKKNSIKLGLLSGLIALVRPNNALIGLVFILYKVVNWDSLKEKLQLFWSKKIELGLLLFFAFLVLIPQLLYWKMITGHLVYNSYVGERFFFDRPRFYLGLFSYTKGWFVYTPMIILAILGGLFFMRRSAKDFSWAFPIFLVINVYVVLSWFCWWYGGGYSQRAFIDSYGLMAIGMGALLNWAKDMPWRKWSVGIVFTALLALSVFQNWQYKEHIIHWDSMSKETYWMVFLKTSKPEGFDKALISPHGDLAKEGKIGWHYHD